MHIKEIGQFLIIEVNIMKKLILLTVLSLILVACEKSDKTKATSNIQDVDNTERNMHDRNSDSLTPIDQSESEADLNN